MGFSFNKLYIMIIRSIVILIFSVINIKAASDNSKEAMKEIKPPNLMLEKMRSLHKRKADADFRPHRPPTFSQQNTFSAPSSSSYGSPAAPASSGYGSPAADPVNEYKAPSDDDSEEIDLHNKEFCVDVSTYQPVVWVERDGQVCKT